MCVFFSLRTFQIELTVTPSWLQLVNLRFDFEPAAVAFPTTIQEVSDIVKLGDKINHQVVARSGGVRQILIRGYSYTR